MNSTSSLYGMNAFSERLPGIPQMNRHSRLIVFGKSAFVTQEIWLHRSPSCEENRLPMKIIEKKRGYFLAQMEKGFVPEDDWSYPLFVCTHPSAAPFEFQSVLLTDYGKRHLVIHFIVFCGSLVLSALFTGLNLALMSLDMEDLRRIREFDDNPVTRRYAGNIIPFRENENFMFCTILLGNTICNTLNALVFDQMVDQVEMGRFRIVIVTIAPTAFIMIFSEILPQVICTKFALHIGSHLRHVMVFFMVITFPISYILGKLLDVVIGKAEIRTSMEKRMLSGLMRQQKEETAQLAEVVEKAINLQVRRVKDIMTPIEKVFMISEFTPFNAKLKEQLNEYRHTRIPVFKGDDKNCIIGVLNVKDLLLIDDSLDLRVGLVMQLWHRSTQFRYVSSETPVTQMMLELKRGFPLAIVIDFHENKRIYDVVGLITLEDNLEEVIGEIYDEKDVHHTTLNNLLTPIEIPKALRSKRRIRCLKTSQEATEGLLSVYSCSSLMATKRTRIRNST